MRNKLSFAAKAAAGTGCVSCTTETPSFHVRYLKADFLRFIYKGRPRGASEPARLSFPRHTIAVADTLRLCDTGCVPEMSRPRERKEKPGCAELLAWFLLLRCGAVTRTRERKRNTASASETLNLEVLWPWHPAAERQVLGG